MRGTFTRSSDHISTFELSAQYVLTGAPDVLDLYELADADYGIKIARVRGHGHGHRQVQISWSPILRQDAALAGAAATNVSQGIDYKLYLGYSQDDLDMFASLCQLEAYEHSEHVSDSGDDDHAQLRIPTRKLKNLNRVFGRTPTRWKRVTLIRENAMNNTHSDHSFLGGKCRWP